MLFRSWRNWSQEVAACCREGKGWVITKQLWALDIGAEKGPLCCRGGSLGLGSGVVTCAGEEGREAGVGALSLTHSGNLHMFLATLCLPGPGTDAHTPLAGSELTSRLPASHPRPRSFWLLCLMTLSPSTALNPRGWRLCTVSHPPWGPGGLLPAVALSQVPSEAALSFSLPVVGVLPLSPMSLSPSLPCLSVHPCSRRPGR